ncbi:MAG: HD domain-containing protein [Actinomycetota bacterium]|nr:HD domain-containing protein [Actinomycetota bacterium]
MELPADQQLGPRFDRALSLARELHTKQQRKGSDIPYLAHLLGVASLVLEDGGSEDEAIAALLHDAVEDQGGQQTLGLIRKQFGKRVAEIVLACSDTDVVPKPPWKARKQAYIDHIADPALDQGILRVSLADKLHNARAILFDLHVVEDELWERFSADRSEVLWYYESLADAFAARNAGPMVQELGRVLAEIAAKGN